MSGLLKNVYKPHNKSHKHYKWPFNGITKNKVFDAQSHSTIQAVGAAGLKIEGKKFVKHSFAIREAVYV